MKVYSICLLLYTQTHKGSVLSADNRCSILMKNFYFSLVHTYKVTLV